MTASNADLAKRLMLLARPANQFVPSATYGLDGPGSRRRRLRRPRSAGGCRGRQSSGPHAQSSPLQMMRGFRHWEAGD